MFRIGLAIYLMLVTLVGPWLCCCTAARVTVGLLRSTAARPAAADDTRPACCRHHSAERPQVAADENSHRESPRKPGCPCGQDLNRTVSGLETESARQLQLAPAVPNPTDIVTLPNAILATSAEGSALAPRERRALPFWSASDLLRVLHLLRC
jgi:hypothetical protein